MRVHSSAPFVALALIVAGSGWLLLPAADGIGAEDAPIEAASAGCDPCVTVVDAAPTHDHFENMIAVSPVDPMTVVTASMYRDNGSFTQIGLWASQDGGATWTQSALPYGENAPLLHPLRLMNAIVDPAVAVASDGTVLFAGVAFTAVSVPPSQIPAQGILFVARSTDGGLTFPIEGVSLIQRSTAPFQDFPDMPRFATGPDGLVLLAWGSVSLPEPLALPRFLATQNVAKAAGIEARFSVSHDAGMRWTSPALAFADDATTTYYPAHPTILNDGSWIFMPGDYQNLAGGSVYMVRSTDEGATWTWEDTGIVALIHGIQAVSRTDGRLYYSYLIPTGDLNWVIPAVAIAESHAGPWTAIALTDEPVRRLSIEQTIAVDATGTAHLVYMTQAAGEPTAVVRIASVLPDGSFTTRAMDELRIEQLATHYFGLDALPSGAIASWSAGDAPYSLHAGAVRTG